MAKSADVQVGVGDVSERDDAEDGSVEPPVDGRTARRDRNRVAVLDAAIALFAEGGPPPGVPAVAERSGVSLRSVYRYFEDTDALLRAAIQRHAEQLEPYYAIADLGRGPVEDRIDAFVRARLRLYEKSAPLVRITLQRAPQQPLLGEQLDRVRRRLREQLEQQFAPELDRLPVAARRSSVVAVDVLFQFEAIEHLRVHLGLSTPATREALVRAVRAILLASA